MDGFLTGALGKEGWEISENDNILQVRFLKEAPSTEILKALDTITGRRSYRRGISSLQTCPAIGIG